MILWEGLFLGKQILDFEISTAASNLDPFNKTFMQNKCFKKSLFLEVK